MVNYVHATEFTCVICNIKIIEFITHLFCPMLSKYIFYFTQNVPQKPTAINVCPTLPPLPICL